MTDPLADAAAKKAYTILEFCTLHGLSRTLYHKLARAGRGPQTMNVNGLVRISAESARIWRRAMEKAPRSRRADNLNKSRAARNAALR